MDPNNVGIDPHLAYLLPFFGIFAIVGIFIYIIPFWMIFKKAGFSPWLSLLLFVPLANIIILYVLAFSQWRVTPLPQYGAYPPAMYPPAYPPAAPPPVTPADPNYRG